MQGGQNRDGAADEENRREGIAIWNLEMSNMVRFMNVASEPLQMIHISRHNADHAAKHVQMSEQRKVRVRFLHSAAPQDSCGLQTQDTSRPARGREPYH